jgi:hypothetical protein
MTKTLKETWTEIGRLFDLQKEPRVTVATVPPPKKSDGKKRKVKRDKNTSKAL